MLTWHCKSLPPAASKLLAVELTSGTGAVVLRCFRLASHDTSWQHKPSGPPMLLRSSSRHSHRRSASGSGMVIPGGCGLAGAASLAGSDQVPSPGSVTGGGGEASVKAPSLAGASTPMLLLSRTYSGVAPSSGGGGGHNSKLAARHSVLSRISRAPSVSEA